MDNPTHHHQQVVQLNNANPQTNIKSPGEMDNFLTIRLLMQGKVRFHFSNYFLSVSITKKNLFRKSVASLENVVII